MGQFASFGVFFGQILQSQLLRFHKGIFVVESRVIEQLAGGDSQGVGNGFDHVGGGVLAPLLDVAEVALRHSRFVSESLQREGSVGTEPADGYPYVIGEPFLRHVPVLRRVGGRYVLQCMGWHGRMQPSERDIERAIAARAERSGMTERVLFIDPWTGVSGDMLLGALLDVCANLGEWAPGAGGPGDDDPARLGDTGGPSALLEEVVRALGLPVGLVEVTASVQKGVACTRLVVRGEEAPPLRHLADMEKMIASAPLTSWVKERSLSALRRLAEVEAGIHGCSVEDIHFHEVGAADTMVDVVGTFALVEALGVDAVMVGPVQVGGGTVEIAHGLMGVPAPATARLLAGYPVVGGPDMRELTTPTGALLVGQLQAEAGPMPAMTVRAIGYGGGSMSLDCGPNVLRVLVGERPTSVSAEDTGRGGESVLELQTNLDDTTPEVVAYAARRLRDAGALDVWTSGAQGKKDRAVMVLHVLTMPECEEELVTIIFAETGTLGIRRLPISRWVAERGHVAVTVAGRTVEVKWGRWDGHIVSLAPEYEQAAAAASEAELPLQEVMAAARAAAKDALGDRL